MSEDVSVDAPVRIGNLARELGLTSTTIRYYETLGLLPTPERSAAGYRLYGARHRERLHFIAQAKALGFTLQEISEIIGLREAGEEPCAHVRFLIEGKLTALTTQIQLLMNLHATLQQLQSEAAATTCSCTPICSIIELHVFAATQAPSPT